MGPPSAPRRLAETNRSSRPPGWVCRTDTLIHSADDPSTSAHRWRQRSCQSREDQKALVLVSTVSSKDNSTRNRIIEITPYPIRRKVEMDHFRFASPIVKLDPGHSPRGPHDNGGECPGVQPRNCVVGHGEECANSEWQESWSVNPAAMLSMLPARRADKSNFFSAGRVDMTHQTAVLLRIKIPECVATTEPNIPNLFSELHCPTIVIDQQDFPRAELRATVLSLAVEEHDTVARLPVQLLVLAAAIIDARMPDFYATPSAN